MCGWNELVACMASLNYFSATLISSGANGTCFEAVELLHFGRGPDWVALVKLFRLVAVFVTITAFLL